MTLHCRRYALLPFVFLLSCPAFAQRAFQVLLPELAPADKRPAIQTPDGGFCILAGYQEPGTENRSFVLLKTAPDGTPEWQRTLSTDALNDYPVALRRTRDGGFLALGATSAPDSWDQDILLIRLTEHGYPVWSRTYDFSALDWASDLVLLEDGSAVIVGSTQATDSAAARSAIEAEGGDITDPNRAWVYGSFTAEQTLIFRVDAEGEPLWGGWLREQSENRNEWSGKSCAQAVCVQQDNSVALIQQMQWSGGSESSIVVRVNADGTPLSGMEVRDEAYAFGSMSFANDLVSSPDGDVLVAGIMVYTAPTRALVTQGYLFRLDRANQIVWHKAYSVDEGKNSFPMTIAPMEENRFLIAGRTTFTGIMHTDYDNPILGVVDAEGTPVESKQWITELKDLPSTRSNEHAQEVYMNWPLFIPTDDQGALSIGTIAVGSNDYGIRYGAGMLITRLNPDLTLCGDNESQAITLTPDSPSGAQIYLDDSYDGPRIPTDVITQDLRRYSQQDIVGFADIAVAAPEFYPYATMDSVKTDNVMNVEYAEDYEYDQINIAQAPSLSEEESGEDVVMVTAESIDDNSDYSYAPARPAAMDTAASYDDYRNVDDMHAYDDYAEEYASDTAAPYDDYGYEEGEEEAYDYAADYTEEGAVTGGDLKALFSATDVDLVRLDVRSHILPDMNVEESNIPPWFVCGSAQAPLAYIAPEESTPTKTGYLHLLPNSVQKGKSTTAEFRLQTQVKPEIEVISVGSGRTVERVPEKELTWGESTGGGSATIETSGLAAGVYLVRVHSGETQLTAKLEVR